MTFTKKSYLNITGNIHGLQLHSNAANDITSKLNWLAFCTVVASILQWSTFHKEFVTLN